MIKVFQVVECGGPGGTGEQVAAICNGLDPARFEVSLAYATRGTPPEEYRAKCRGAKAAYFVPEMTREIAPALDLRAVARLRRLFAEHRPAVVHAHSSKAGVLARAAARAAGVPKVFYTPHGYGFLMRDRSVAARALYRAVEAAASRVGTVVACSPSEAAEARRLTRRVETVCDAYLGDFPEPLPHAGLRIGSSGRMTAARNPDAWVRLAGRLVAGVPGAVPVWIGGGEDEPRARERLAALGLAGKVEVTGWVDAAEARRAVAALDLFVHYSRWDALSNAVLEAMAAGLPVVASDIPGNRDLVTPGETGLLAGDEDSLFDACRRLAADPDLRRRLGAAGRERVRREFSLARMIGALERLYSA